MARYATVTSRRAARLAHPLLALAFHRIGDHALAGLREAVAMPRAAGPGGPR
jgi:p-aminobenzoyl-glutamate transporter AbgT